MSDDTNRPVGSVQYLLGSISAQLQAIENVLSRQTLRIDDLERRTEVLEMGVGRSGLWVSFIEKAVWGILGAAGVFAMKAMGVV